MDTDTHAGQPQLRDLMVILREAQTGWHDVGTQLDVPHHELARIEKENTEITRRLKEMLHYWLKNDEEPTWEKIREALVRIGGYNNICREITIKY